MVKIEISPRTNEICIKALKAALSIYKGDIKPTIEILKNGFVNPPYFDDQGITIFNDYLKTLNLWEAADLEKLLEKIDGNLNGEKNLTLDELDLICYNLEIIERVWIGQWGILTRVSQDYIVDHLNIINPLRDKMTDAYSRKGLRGYASYGIYSPELKDEVRLLYAFQKVFYYEKMATGTDSTPFTLEGELGKDIPKIILPYKEVITFRTLEEIKKYSEEWMKRQEEEYLLTLDRKKIYCENDNSYFFPTKPGTSYLVEPGDTVFLKQNDYFVVEKTKENLDRWNL